MPYGDGTGPVGTGPNGGGRGPCGRGMRRGGGYGRGFGSGNAFGRPVPPAYEKENAGEEVQALKARLTELEKRLGETKGVGK